MNGHCPACGFDSSLWGTQAEWDRWLALMGSSREGADLGIGQLIQAQEAMLARAREYRRRQHADVAAESRCVERRAAVELAVQALAPIAGGFRSMDDYNEAVTVFAAGLDDYIQNGS